MQTLIGSFFLLVQNNKEQLKQLVFVLSDRKTKRKANRCYLKTPSVRRADPPIPVETKPFPAPDYGITEQGGTPDGHAEQIANRDQQPQAQNIAAPHHEPA